MIGLHVPLGIILATSTTADVISTRLALMRCTKCIEGNPIMRPFAGSTVALSAIQGAGNTGLFLMSLKFKEHHKKTWWIPLAAYIGFHTFAAIHNSKISDRRER